MNVWNAWLHYLDMYAWLLQGEQWRRSDNLAQASGSCLSESIRKPTQVPRELSLRRQATILSESPSHSSEEVSPMREYVTVPLIITSSPRLGERSSPERETLSPERDLSA